MTCVFDNPEEFAKTALAGFASIYSRNVRPVIGGVVRSTVTPEGKVYTLGRNAQQMAGAKVRGTSELAGVCFSPDGSTLFVNIYSPGCTLAVTGPWRSFRA